MSSDRPNILFVFADQWRGFDLGCMGNEQVATPNLDRLASEGALVPQAFANAPVCTPSRGVMLTGRLPLEHGAIANDLPLGRVRCIAEALGDAGWLTGYIGKWHLDGVPRDKFTPPGKRRHGFTYWASYNCSHRYFRKEKYYLDEPSVVLADGYEPSLQTDLACAFIRDHAREPFALWVSWGPPHDPYGEAPERYRQMYDPSHLTLRPNARTADRNPLAVGMLEDPTAALAGYYASMSALDEQMGRLLRQLEESGLGENTIVIFTSDHGDMMWSQGMLKKQLPWEEAIRVPLIVRWPAKIPAGLTCDVLASSLDLVPTICGLTQVDFRAPLAGYDLTAALLGETDPGPESVFLMEIVPTDEGVRQGVGEWRAVRTRRYTYAERLGRKPWLLYDNLADPFQQQNLVGHPQSEAARGEMSTLLAGWLKAANDEFRPGADHIRQAGLLELWRARQAHLHPGDRRFV